MILQLSQTIPQSPHCGSGKTSFVPLMNLGLAGIGIEAKMRGESYFDLHFGIKSIELGMCEHQELLKTKV